MPLRERLGYLPLSMLINALWPRAAGWPFRSGVRGVLAYVATMALLPVATRTLAGWGARGLLREALGREPTDAEVEADLRARWAQGT